MDTQINSYITGEPAFAVDRRGSIVLWNDAAEKTLGIPKSKALGNKCWKLLCGKDAYGNRHCCKLCPIREMAIRHEPVNTFHSTFKTAADKPEHFAVTCLTVFDEPGNEILLHICHPETKSAATSNRKLTETDHQPETLSHREIEVLGLLAEKVSTRDIATRLSISIRTVRTHIQHLMYKLQVHKRKEAIETGKRLKLI
jgi:DNA-binding CsgD family transcriptional regulator